MKFIKGEKLRIDWVLVNKLGLGKPPLKENDFDLLKQKRIKTILNLCEEEEVPAKRKFHNGISFRRFPLPDHKVRKKLTKKEILEVIQILDDSMKAGPVFVHCYASIERSPFVCIAWLVLKEKVNFVNALDHVKQVHKESNPMTEHLNLLRKMIL